MLYNNELKAIYLAPPKTGTRSMNLVLHNQYKFKQYKAPHFDKIPNQFKDYYSFITVRNPYDRIVSTWWFFFKNEKKFQQKFFFTEDLRSNTQDLNRETLLLEFLQYIKDNREIRKAGFRYLQPQSHYIDNNKIDKFLNLEDIENEFKTLFFYKELDKKFPIINTSKNKDETFNYINNESLLLINELYEDDFDKLKYEKIIN